jgi:hypothetical protein
VGRLNRRRLENLESRAWAEAIEEEGLTSAQMHYRRAFVRAMPAEQDALRELCEGIGDEAEKWRLWEEVLRRQSPTLADDIRAHRDLLHRELYRLEREWEQEGHITGIGERGRALSAVGTARVNRRTALSRGVEPIEDEEEAHSLVEQITAPATSLAEVLELIEISGADEEEGAVM